MKNWIRTTILILISVIVTIVLVNVILSFKKEIGNSTAKTPIKIVETNQVYPSQIVSSIHVSGNLKSYNRIELFSEVNGVLLNQNFRTGTKFNKGEVMVDLDATELKYTLKAQKSNFLNQVARLMGDIELDYAEEKNKWIGFLEAIDVDKTLPELPEISNKTFKRYLAGKNILNAYYSIKSQENRLEKYTITAPFNGTLIEANLKKGTLVRAGQKLGEFIEKGIYELEAEISNKDLSFVTIGNEVHLSSSDLSKSWKGEVRRINDIVNSSQKVSVFITVEGNDLKEGLFLEGKIRGKTFNGVVEVDRKLLHDKKLFVVEDSLLIEKNVEVLYVFGEKALVNQLDSGETIVTGNIKGLISGMRVKETKIDL